MSDSTNIYKSMMGFAEESHALSWVANAFGEGELCAREYDQMRSTYEQLCQRLNAGQEDPDLDRLVSSLERIQKELCIRMFECGIQYIWQKHYLDP